MKILIINKLIVKCCIICFINHYQMSVQASILAIAMNLYNQ